MNPQIRPSAQGEEEPLKALWQTVFGDTRAYIDLFFRHCYAPGRATVATVGGRIVSAAHVIPAGQLHVPGAAHIPCVYIYALGTLPGFRGMGLARRVVEAAAARHFSEGYGCCLVRPGEASLFSYYEALDFTPCFPIQAFQWQGDGTDAGNGKIMSISSEEYAQLRATLLPPFAVHTTPELLAFQAALGSLLRLEADGHAGCAVAERAADGQVRIKELLLPKPLVCRGAALLAARFKTERLQIRTPATGTGRPFALGRFRPGTPVPDGSGYFAFAFD